MSQDITQEWLDQHRELIRKTVCPRGIPDPEFELFMLQCMRSGLDPLLKQAFCVAREAKGEVIRDAKGNPVKEQGSNGKWYDKRERITRYEFQPSEAGMLARAERFPDFRGVYAGAVCKGDECAIDEGAGTVVHRFNPADRKGDLIGAWARLERHGRAHIVKWLDLAAYVQTTPLWTSKAATMIEKCARVAVLRLAYPEAFGGLYTAEERPAEEDVVVESNPIGQTSRPALPPPAERITLHDANFDRVAATLENPPEPTPALKAMAQKRREPGEDDGEEAVAHAVVAFGPHKGKTTAELSDAELNATVDMAHDRLATQPNAKWAKAMRMNLEALEAELSRRISTMKPTPSPEATT